MFEKPKFPIRLARGAAGWIALLFGLYFLAALIGSHVPVNADWREPKDGIELFVETNGVHTGIVMPMAAAGNDWSDLVKPAHLAEPARAGTHILVGWGHAGVFRNAPRWADLRSADALSAVIGSDRTLLHVYFERAPQAAPHRRRLIVTPAAYRKIVAAIRSRFRLDAAGRSMPSPGYGRSDLFYEARGHYNLFNTCNNWTSEVLGTGGVKTGLWTPFAGGVMRWFPAKEPY